MVLVYGIGDWEGSVEFRVLLWKEVDDFSSNYLLSSAAKLTLSQISKAY
jgi:hypothetical protein